MLEMNVESRESPWPFKDVNLKLSVTHLVKASCMPPLFRKVKWKTQIFNVKKGSDMLHTI